MWRGQMQMCKHVCLYDWDQMTVVSVDRWSLYRGARVSLRWPMEQPTVVTIDRWSLRQVSLYIRTSIHFHPTKIVSTYVHVYIRLIMRHT